MICTIAVCIHSVSAQGTAQKQIDVDNLLASLVSKGIISAPANHTDQSETTQTPENKVDENKETTEIKETKSTEEVG